MPEIIIIKTGITGRECEALRLDGMAGRAFLPLTQQAPTILSKLPPHLYIISKRALFLLRKFSPLLCNFQEGSTLWLSEHVQILLMIIPLLLPLLANHSRDQISLGKFAEAVNIEFYTSGVDRDRGTMAIHKPPGDQNDAKNNVKMMLNKMYTKDSWWLF